MQPCSAACAGVDKMTWLIDFEGYSLRNAPPLKVSLQTTHLLQNHYPERLGLAICYHPPVLFSLTYKVGCDCVSSRALRVVHLLQIAPVYAGCWPAIVSVMLPRS